MRKSIITALAVCIGMAFCCFGPIRASDRASETLHVFVSIPPQARFVKAIGGGHVDVSVMVRPEKSPASYEPSPRQMTTLARSEIYFAIGVPFESSWLENFATANPDMRIIHTEKGLAKQPIRRSHEDESRREGPEKGKDRIKDPHIWLSPPLVMLQARRILAGLCAADPANRADYRKNYRAFIQHLAALDAELMQQLETVSNPRFMVYHPSWGYFADAYGLRQIPIEVAGKAPKARKVKELIKTAKHYELRQIFVQPQFSTRQARIIAKEIGARLVAADPLAKNWEHNLRTVAEAIKNQ
ncbi:MAG TPA: zinc ABC transporter substrate-binding protein [Desulfosalsimonadaceae bacterium]|nr:zinc ABC transporter substrate-binding protein [Desulfosalsimonadaceae bacterium]